MQEQSNLHENTHFKHVFDEMLIKVKNYNLKSKICYFLVMHLILCCSESLFLKFSHKRTLAALNFRCIVFFFLSFLWRYKQPLLPSSTYETAVILCYGPLSGAKSLEHHQGCLGLSRCLAAAEHTVLGRAELWCRHSAMPRCSLTPCCQGLASTGTFKRLVNKQK